MALKYQFQAPVNIDNGYTNERVAREVTHHMELFVNGDEGTIEWIIEALDTVTHIGVWFTDKTLVDYDGVYEIPTQALDFLEHLGYNVEDFR